MKNNSTRAGAVGIVCSIATMISIVLSSGNVRTNAEGLELIGNAESCRRDPYICPTGYLTDGVGNTHGVKKGTIKNDAQIAADWEKNILDAERCVNQYGNGKRLGDNMFSAAVSLTFRVGCGKVRNSTMFQFFRAGPANYTEACHQFTRWVWGGGKVLPGLVTRAGKEENLCLKEDAK